MSAVCQRVLRILGVILLSLGCSSAGRAAEDGPFRTVKNDAFLVVFSGGRPLLQYRHDGMPRKPYIKELFTPGGLQVLRDAPADHLHHHGIMFALSADGVSFWEESPQGGRQVSREISPPQAAAGPGASRMSFTHRLDWIPPGTETPTLEERRTIEILELDGAAPTVVSWQTQLRPAGRESVELTGSHYYGLGVRLLQAFDRVGRFTYAAEPGPIVRGEERVTRSAWCAYVAPAEDAVATIALFDHPGNPRHPATMFTMPEKFAYLAATLNLGEEPLTVEADRPLTLVYGVALWDGPVTAEEIEQVYRRWIVQCSQP